MARFLFSTSSKSCVSAPASAAPAPFRTKRTAGEIVDDYIVAVVAVRSTGSVCALGVGRSPGGHPGAGSHVGTRAGGGGGGCTGRHARRTPGALDDRALSHPQLADQLRRYRLDARLHGAGVDDDSP